MAACRGARPAGRSAGSRTSLRTSDATLPHRQPWRTRPSAACPSPAARRTAPIPRPAWRNPPTTRPRRTPECTGHRPGATTARHRWSRPGPCARERRRPAPPAPPRPWQPTAATPRSPRCQGAPAPSSGPSRWSPAAQPSHTRPGSLARSDRWSPTPLRRRSPPRHSGGRPRDRRPPICGPRQRCVRLGPPGTQTSPQDTPEW
jgi:hypothetical protein